MTVSHHLVRFSIVAALIGAAVILTAQSATDAKAISAAKNAIARDFHPALPRESIEAWLASLLGADRAIKWEVNDCGEQSGDPAVDRGRDFPMCVEARAPLSGARTLSLSFMVGTMKKGVTGPPVYRFGFLIGPGDRLQDVGTLDQVASLIKTAAARSLSVRIRIISVRRARDEEEAAYLQD
jgi:hypothetical protein